MTQTTTQPAPPADQKTVWLDEEIWPEIIAMMHGDAYFRLWMKANEVAATPYGPIGQTIVNGYVTYQLAAIRRQCDRSRMAISLPKILKMIGREQSRQRPAADALATRLEQECAELCALATQYVAHNGNPAAPDRQSWGVTLEKITQAHRAICEVAANIERDLLAIRQRVHLVPVLQGDYLAEVKSFVPADKLPTLRNFWHAHNDSINGWVHVPRVMWRATRPAKPPRARAQGKPLAGFLAGRGYLPKGVPLRKRIVALPVQTVCRTDRAVIVDAIALGEALRRDRRGWKLRVWQGFCVAPAGEVFLMNWQSEDSLDGCYFCSPPATAIIGRPSLSGSLRRIEGATNLSIFLRPMAVADTKSTLIPGHGLYRRDHVDRLAALRSSGARHGHGDVFDAGGRPSRELRTDDDYDADDPSRRWVGG